MDMIFLNEKNIIKNTPLMIGLIGWYNISVEGYSTRALLPYCQALSKFAPHIQQLTMESNGKGVNMAGEFLGYETGAVHFGEPGTNG